jgi:hypothetical protein
MTWFLEKWRNEPAVVIGLVTALLDLGTLLFPWVLTAEQKIGIVTVVTAAGGLVTRSQVSPANR